MTLTLEERSRRVAIVCCAIVRNVGYYRTGHRIAKRRGHFDRANKNANFWRTVDANFMDIATLDWCTIFADERGKHSWKKVVREEMQDEFYNQLLSVLRTNNDQYQEYIGYCRAYRDKFLAHLDDDRVAHTPKLIGMAKSAAHLCEYLRSKNPEWFADLPLTMKGYYRHSCNEVRRIYSQFDASN